MPFIHGTQGRVLLDKWNLSPWLKQSTMDFQIEMADTTSLMSTDKGGIPGHRSATYDLGGMMSIDTSAAHVDMVRAIMGQSTNPQPHSILSIGYEGFAAGKAVWGGFGYMSGYRPETPFNNVVMLSPRFVSDDKLAIGRSLHDILAGVTATGTGTAVDNAAATTLGGQAMLHVIANDRNGSTTIKVQHSADNSTWADLLTFTAIGAAGLTSPGVRMATSATTTVNRYLRATWTLAGSTGSITFAVVFYRNTSLN